MWNFIATSNDIGWVVKLAFIISSGTLWGKSRFNETVFRFSPSFDSEQKTLGRVVTPASTVSRGTFWKETRIWTKLFFFSLVEWLLVEFRTATCVSRRTFLATLFWKINLLFWFSDFEQKFCKTFSEKLSAFFQNLIPCEQKIRLRKELFDGKIRLYSSFSDIGRWLNVTFGKKGFRGACQMCLFTRPEKLLGQNNSLNVFI